jgi:predicted amidohydrolase YtcJ
MSGGLLIRNAILNGRPCDLRIVDGIVAEIGRGLRSALSAIDAKGGEVIPGLIDHHIHLFATAAEANSLTASSDVEFPPALRDTDSRLAAGEWLRVTGYHDSFHGPLDAARLDAIVPHRPVRVQYRTGSLWVLNSCGLAQVLGNDAPPDWVERDDKGQPTGRIWRGDAWLRERLASTPPSLSALGQALARQGVTHLTDASASTDDAAAAYFSGAIRRSELPQHLMLMSAQALNRDADAPWSVGPLKILLDDHALPPLEWMEEQIAAARKQHRRVAVHCVAAGELALSLATFGTAGARPGDRVEHGGIIAEEAIAEIKRLGLAVVTQPEFVAERGDTYLEDVEPRDHPDLYRCASLIAAGIKVGGSTDAPYTRPDVWGALSAAIHRTTKSGVVLGAAERLPPRRALALFQSDFADPGGAPRRVEAGAPADLAVLRDRFETLAQEDFCEPVKATVIAGKIAWGADRLE